MNAESRRQKLAGGALSMALVCVACPSTSDLAGNSSGASAPSAVVDAGAEASVRECYRRELSLGSACVRRDAFHDLVRKALTAGRDVPPASTSARRLELTWPSDDDDRCALASRCNSPFLSGTEAAQLLVELASTPDSVWKTAGRARRVSEDLSHALRWLAAHTHDEILASSCSDELTAFGRLELAECFLDRLVELGAIRSDRGILASAYVRLGEVFALQGKTDAAEQYFKRGLAFSREIDAKRWSARAEVGLGSVFREHGRFDEAESHYRAAMRSYSVLGNEEGIADSLANLGLVARDRNALSAAEQYFVRSLTTNRSLGRRRAEARDWASLGLLEVARHDRDRAGDYFRKAIEIDEALGLVRWAAVDRALLGRLLLEQGRVESAREQLERAVPPLEAGFDRDLLGTAYANLGEIARRKGDLRQALSFYGKSAAQFASEDQRALEAAMWMKLIEEELASGSDPDHQK